MIFRKPNVDLVEQVRQLQARVTELERRANVKDDQMDLVSKNFDGILEVTGALQRKIYGDFIA